MSIALSLRNLSKTFDGTHFVNQHISFDLHQGEILTLLGASGCGKTTLLRMIAGFETPHSGEIIVAGRTVFDGKTALPARQRKIGYVVQEGILFPHMSVYHNVAYGLGNGKGQLPEEREKIEAMLALTDILPLANAMPHQLSGGQQQRVALARALVVEPELILLDEPFSALDQYLRAKIRADMLAILKKAKTSAIIVTHDCEEALLCSDRIALLENGKLVQLDTPQNLYYHPNSLGIAQFIGDTLLLEGTLKSPTQAVCLCGNLAIYPSSAEIGTQGIVMIRPESITLTPLSQTHHQGVIAKLINQQFQGKQSLVEVEIDGQQIQFQLANRFCLQIGERYLLEVSEPAKFYLE
ncbi:hypothetical protein A4G19_09000 [Pasteurellaceae bacterium Macca]|nr:hypothetical protein [Pasteurellaceae bacterium Macca]